MKKRFFISIAVLILTIAVLLIVILVPASGSTAQWYKDTKEGINYFASNAEQTRFLIGRPTDDRYQALAVLDQESGTEIPLYYVESDSVSAAADISFRAMKVSDETRTAYLEKHTPGEYLMKERWGSIARVKETGGYYFLSYSPDVGYNRINMNTGETVLLTEYYPASITDDGRMLLYQTNEKVFCVLEPDSTEPTPVFTADVMSVVHCASLLSDGSIWYVHIGPLGQKEIDGEKGFLLETFLTHCDAAGNPITTINLGEFNINRSPERMLYSEAEETAVLCSSANIAYVMLVDTETETVRFLVLDDDSAAKKTLQNRGDALDAWGYPISNTCHNLYVMGLSADEKEILLADMNIDSVMRLKLDSLDSLDMKTVLTMSEIERLFKQKSDKVYLLSLFYNTQWNGSRMICGISLANAYHALQIP